MATRPIEQIQHGVIRPFLLQSGQSLYVGRSCIFGAASTDSGMNYIQDAAGATDVAIGIVRPSPYADSTGLINAANIATGGGVATTAQIEVLMFWPVIVPMQVGTGNSTRGKKQKLVSDGVTDATTGGGGTVAEETYGVALQSGVVGDMIGVGLSVNSRVHA